MVNPFPLSRARRGGRAHAHHNPAELWRPERTGRYRPKVPQRIPRQIPDEHFDALFAGLCSHRDRALVAFFCSSGARAAELLGASCGDVDPGAQLITVIRKGSRALQQLPASPDAFVWLRLYQAQMEGLVSLAADEPLFWTLRRPFRQLSYHATCNGCSATRISKRRSCTCVHRPTTSSPRSVRTTPGGAVRRRRPAPRNTGPSRSPCCSSGPVDERERHDRDHGARNRPERTRGRAGRLVLPRSAPRKDRAGSSGSAPRTFPAAPFAEAVGSDRALT